MKIDYLINMIVLIKPNMDTKVQLETLLMVYEALKKVAEDNISDTKSKLNYLVVNQRFEKLIDTLPEVYKEMISDMTLEDPSSEHTDFYKCIFKLGAYKLYLSKDNNEIVNVGDDNLSQASSLITYLAYMMYDECKEIFSKDGREMSIIKAFCYDNGLKLINITT
jgi:hypothetical protein